MIRIICGLGNPGSQYEHTRHNLGFDVVDQLAESLTLGQTGHGAHFDYVSAAGEYGEIYIIKPRTFVNKSGLAAAEALKRFDCRPEELFVISDDFELPLGRLRIRKSGSSGGHKGLISIIEAMETENFGRLRLGTGPLPDDALDNSEEISEFVLSRFLPGETEIAKNMITRSVEALKLILNNNLDLAITNYNNANPTPEK